jgi:eukaryotic-like serine/threonine-protein kinase
MERTVVDNRYALSGLLGGGGMGKVYLACDRVLDRDVALKVLREQYAEDEEFVERFGREAKAAASLNHPHIVSVYDRGTAEDGTYYIAMEHVPGGTLKDRILKGGPLDPAEAVRTGAQVAEALGVAHEAGVVHRDVKPHNVLLTAAGDAKVADFGIARAASEASLSDGSLVLGTAKYMSPEQAMGDQVGPESDLYSLGVVLYEMLTGEVPFEADSAVGVAMKHVTESPRPPKEANPGIPEALNGVVLRLLQKRLEDRYPGAAELVEDLRRAGEGIHPVFGAAPDPRAGGAATETRRLAAPAPAPESLGGVSRASPWAPRRRRVRLLAAVVVALLAALGVVALGQLRGHDGPVLGSLGEAQRALGIGKAEVPKVEGMTEEEARERLGEEGLGVSVERRQSPREDEGEVLEQSVPAGNEIERGSRIALAVGSGPRTARMPKILGLTPEEARAELEEAGLELGERREAPSGEVPEGEVATQDPAAGKELEVGTEVDLTVSSGPPQQGEADRVDVPDVSGLDADAATELLEEAGCEVVGTRERPGPEPKGTVVGTDPPVGTAVASGTPVVLVVSGGQGAPPAGAGDRAGSDPGAAPSSSASAAASASASASPEPPSGSGPAMGDPPAPSSPAPAPPPPSPSPEPSSPEPSSPGSAPPAAAPSAAPSSPSSASPASASAGSGEEAEDAEEDEAEDDE